MYFFDDESKRVPKIRHQGMRQVDSFIKKMLDCFMQCGVSGGKSMPRFSVCP
jgi:hypothetical protein